MCKRHEVVKRLRKSGNGTVLGVWAQDGKVELLAEEAVEICMASKWINFSLNFEFNIS